MLGCMHPSELSTSFAHGETFNFWSMIRIFVFLTFQFWNDIFEMKSCFSNRSRWCRYHAVLEVRIRSRSSENHSELVFVILLFDRRLCCFLVDSWAEQQTHENTFWGCSPSSVNSLELQAHHDNGLNELFDKNNFSFFKSVIWKLKSSENEIPDHWSVFESSSLRKRNREFGRVHPSQHVVATQ